MSRQCKAFPCNASKNFIKNCSESNTKGTLLAPKTTLDILSVMKSILVYANTKKYLQYLPPLRFECRPLVKKLVILSERNQKILSSYLCLHLTYRNLGILICMYTGIRLGEICALTWEDISLTEGSIYIDKTIQRVQKEHNGKKTMLIIATPKTPSSIRTIPIPNQLLQIIKNKWASSKRISSDRFHREIYRAPYVSVSFQKASSEM